MEPGAAEAAAAEVETDINHAGEVGDIIIRLDIRSSKRRSMRRRRRSWRDRSRRRRPSGRQRRARRRR
jgi:hypothetical protein